MPRELLAFARTHGYVASRCPDCPDEPPGETCPNCGGSGRLWTSARGSLSDDGILRLRRLVP